MTWWAWTLVWIALVAGVGMVGFALLRSLLRKAVALRRELGRAQQRLGAVSEQIAALDRAGGAGTRSEPLAVFSDPGELRRARDRERRAGVAAAHRRARRRSCSA